MHFSVQFSSLAQSCPTLWGPMDCSTPDLTVHRIMVILNGLLWKPTEIILSFLRLLPSTAFQTLLLTMRATPFLLRDFLPTIVDIMVI